MQSLVCVQIWWQDFKPTPWHQPVLKCILKKSILPRRRQHVMVPDVLLLALCVVSWCSCVECVWFMFSGLNGEFSWFPSCSIACTCVSFRVVRSPSLPHVFTTKLSLMCFQRSLVWSRLPGIFKSFVSVSLCLLCIACIMSHSPPVYSSLLSILQLVLCKK